MNKNVRIGLIGCGYWGSKVLKALMETSGFDVSQVCDQKPGRQEATRRQFPQLNVISDAEQIFNDPSLEAVVLPVTTGMHYHLAKKALEAGKHVWIEKPMTMSSDEARELVELAETKNLQILVGHIFLYSAAVQKLKEVWPRFQPVISLDFVRSNNPPPGTEINVFWDLAVHDFSILFYLMGDQPYELEVWGAYHKHGELADVAEAVFHFSNKTTARVFVSWYSPIKIRTLNVATGAGLLQYNDMDAAARVKIHGLGFDTRVGAKETDTAALQYGAGETTIPPLDATDTLKRECADFLDAIRKNRPPISDGRMGLKVVETLEATDRLLANRRLVSKRS